MRLRPLHPAFGVEVLDVDPLNASAGEIEQIRAALDAHQMLLFRGQGRIAPEQHVEIVSWFGEPAGESDDGALWTVLCNENAAGAARLEFHSGIDEIFDVQPLPFRHPWFSGPHHEADEARPIWVVPEPKGL